MEASWPVSQGVEKGDKQEGDCSKVTLSMHDHLGRYSAEIEQSMLKYQASCWHAYEAKTNCLLDKWHALPGSTGTFFFPMLKLKFTSLLRSTHH